MRTLSPTHASTDNGCGTSAPHAPFVHSLLCCLLSAGLASAQEPAAPDLHAELSELKTIVLALKTELASLRSAGDVASARVRDLEQQIAQHSGSELDTALTEATGKVRAPSAGKGKGLMLGGYFDTEFRIDHAGAQADTFDQHRLVLQLEARVAGPVSFRSEIEFEGGGYMSGSGNYLTGNQILIEYAEAHVDLSEPVKLKVGSLLVPFGQFNAEHDSPLQEFTDRPLVARRIIPSAWNDSGLGLYGSVQPGGITLSYDLALVNGFTEKFSAIDGTRNARASFRKDNNDNKTFVGRVGCSLDLEFLDALSFGVSGLSGKYDGAGEREARMWGFDGRLRKGPFELLGEYANLRLEDGATLATPVPPGMEGWYAEARWRFFPFDESWRGMRMLGERSTFSLNLRFDSVDTDVSGTAVDFATRGDAYRDDRSRWSFGLSFRPVAQSVFKVEYQWFPEPGPLPDVDNDRIVASFATYF